MRHEQVVRFLYLLSAICLSWAGLVMFSEQATFLVSAAGTAGVALWLTGVLARKPTRLRRRARIAFLLPVFAVWTILTLPWCGVKLPHGSEQPVAGMFGASVGTLAALILKPDAFRIPIARVGRDSRAQMLAGFLMAGGLLAFFLALAFAQRFPAVVYAACASLTGCSIIYAAVHRRDGRAR